MTKNGRTVAAVLVLVCATALPGWAAKPKTRKPHARPNAKARLAAPPKIATEESLRLAIADLIETYNADYPRGPQYLKQLDAMREAGKADVSNAEFRQLAWRALLDNPLMKFDRLMLLKRRRGQLGLPTNHQCNACLPQTGYENEIAVLSPVRPNGEMKTLFRPKRGEYVGEIDLHFDADRLLFTMPISGPKDGLPDGSTGRSWQIHEIAVDGKHLRQVSKAHPDVDNFDACYLPNGQIVFASTAAYTAVPCWHGKERACSLYLMNADGSGMRQLCFDQDLDLHPAVLQNGQVVYSRWDYTGTMHMYLRPLMAMNPDGTSQRAIYGSNSYYPNSLFYPRSIPGSPNKLIAVLTGYHGPKRSGELAVLDIKRGWYEAEGIVHRIGHRGKPTEPKIRDTLMAGVWPQFLHPYPLSERYFLAAGQMFRGAPWGIYLVDVFDNMLPLKLDKQLDFFEPIPIQKTPTPPILPDRVDLSRKDATVYMHDIYAGPGLAGVPRGAVKRMRIVGYHYGLPGLAGPDKIGCGGPWEAMRILGTVPVYADGSAKFRLPANTPVTLQPLDAEGKALQLMRSWYTAMPGEVASCVGCHEQPKETPITRNDIAANREPSDIEPWYGPARGFDFQREVQPVLDRYCVSCHNDKPHGGDRAGGQKLVDLRAERFFNDYKGRELTRLGATRLHPQLVQHFGGRRIRYTPTYEALIPFIRRVNIEDDVNILVPGEYHADTSELIQMLRKGHHGVRLDAESWDRLVTWIDLNGPCHGTWNDVAPVPGRTDRKRFMLAKLYGGVDEDFEVVPKLPKKPQGPVAPKELAKPAPVKLAGWPFDAAEAQRRQKAKPAEMTIDLGHGVTMRLVRIPAGQFVIGDPAGAEDEYPLAKVTIDRDFWMGTCEVSNEQFRQWDSKHRTGYFNKRYPSVDGPGLALDGPKQPVVRVSWEQANDFCKWLSKHVGRRFMLPTEAQWEYACRAGTDSPLSFGATDADFSRHANLADHSLGRIPGVTGGLTSSITATKISGIMNAVVYGGDIPCIEQFDDQHVATANVGSFQPNRWGLFDMHGNVAEWTRSSYRPYPYDATATSKDERDRKVVRGGSWIDRPHRARSAFRQNFPAWQRVHNVGFRVVSPITE